MLQLSPLMLGMRCARSISDDLKPTQHLANREKANNLGQNDSGTDQLLLVHVPDLREYVRRLECACFGCGAGEQ
jgi:hypothetical protein